MKFIYAFLSALVLTLAGCGSSGSDDAVSAGGDAGSASDSAGGVASPPPDPGEPPGRPVQAGTLTGGDHDEHLNADHFRAYVNNALQSLEAAADYPKLDLTQRIVVNVVDRNGAPYRASQITVTSDTRTLVQLKTAASGKVYLYRDLDGLPENFRLTASDQIGAVQATRDIVLADLEGQSAVELTLPADAQAATALDLLLVIDTTGSMGDELAYLKAELISIINRIKSANPNVDLRVGLVVYRDVGDDYVVRSHSFTHDVANLQAALNGETHEGGGDYPEAMDQALATALQFDWREQSANVLLLVADAPPHAGEVKTTWNQALAARARQIHIVPVAASGVATEAQYLMRSMAALTQSRYVFLTDDSGVGNPHEEPDIVCYVVTRLNSLISRVIDDLIKGVRSEPAANDIIRTVGNYDAGRCVDG